MLGNYIIFDLEPNKDYIFGILKFSWIICKFNEFNKLITLTSSDYFIKQDDPKYRNHIFKYHGISNKKLQLEGEPLEYVMQRFADDIKVFEVDYIAGFRIKHKNQDLEYLYKNAEKYNLTSLKKDFIQKKCIIVDVYDILGLYLKKNNIIIPITYKDAYPRLFNKMQFPKTKYHNTSIEIQHCKNILFKLIVSDLELFDEFQPLIQEKLDFKKIDEFKDIIDGQLLEQNDNLKQQNHILTSRILELELEIDEYKEILKIKEEKEKKIDEQYEKLKEEKIRLECKKEEHIHKIKRLENVLQETQNKFKKHKDISNSVINNLKDKLSKTQKPLEDLLNEHLKDKYSKYDLDMKQCFICNKKVTDICDGCLKYFCDMHVTLINDGLETSACDKCFNKVYDEFNGYKLEEHITLI